VRLPLLLLLAPLALAAQTHLGRSLDQWRMQLGADNRVERLLAARSLGEMAIAGDAGASEAIFAALDHEDSGVRYWAAVATGEMGESARPAADQLEAKLQDPAPEVRVWAAYAVVQLGRPDLGLQTLIEQMSNPEQGARLQAVTALDQLGQAAAPAIPELAEAVDDSFDYVQRIARHALWTLGQRPCPYQECP